MGWLVAQILGWLILATALGIVIGWLLKSVLGSENERQTQAQLDACLDNSEKLKSTLTAREAELAKHRERTAQLEPLGSQVGYWQQKYADLESEHERTLGMPTRVATTGTESSSSSGHDDRIEAKDLEIATLRERLKRFENREPTTDDLK